MEKGTCKMGWFVRNRVNQFEGFVVGKVYWMFGCEMLILIPKNLESRPLLDVAPGRVQVYEDYLEIMPEEDNTTFEREFVVPDLEKYFGMLCRDKVSGFEGVAIGCITSLHGADSYALEPITKKNKKVGKHEWFDVGRLEVISRRVSTEAVKDIKPGGCELIASRSLMMALG